jgi:phage baseplate assembly protein W
MAAVYPHLALPFAFAARGVVVSGVTPVRYVPVTEQDSLAEIGDCVELTLRTEQGQRRTLPEYGRPQSLAFTQDRELARAQVQAAVDLAEPRVRALVQQGELDPDDQGLLRLLTMYELELTEGEVLDQ